MNCVSVCVTPEITHEWKSYPRFSSFWKIVRRLKIRTNLDNVFERLIFRFESWCYKNGESVLKIKVKYDFTVSTRL